MADSPQDASFRQTLLLVVALSLAYFVIEFAVALVSGSVALFADSIDFLEDASISLIVLVALELSPRMRARIGMGLAALILVPSLATLAAALHKFADPAVPNAVSLSLTGLGALLVNSLCALLLARYRHGGGSLTAAAFLSARNDAVANLAVVAAGLVTAFVWRSLWPDLIIGLAIAALNAGAAREVWSKAREERRA